MSTTLHQCPVCGGRGLVPNGFYSPTYWPHSTINMGDEPCRSCGGKGYIEVTTTDVSFSYLGPLQHPLTSAIIKYEPNT